MLPHTPSHPQVGHPPTGNSMRTPAVRPTAASPAASKARAPSGRRRHPGRQRLVCLLRQSLGPGTSRRHRDNAASSAASTGGGPSIRPAELLRVAWRARSLHAHMAQRRQAVLHTALGAARQATASLVQGGNGSHEHTFTLLNVKQREAAFHATSSKQQLPPTA